MMGQRQPGNESHHHKIQATVSRMAEQSSWVPSPFCLPPGYPFPIKFLALSARVSPQTIHFRVLDKSPLSAQEGIPLFLQQHHKWWVRRVGY